MEGASGDNGKVFELWFLCGWRAHWVEADLRWPTSNAWYERHIYCCPRLSVLGKHRAVRTVTFYQVSYPFTRWFAPLLGRVGGRYPRSGGVRVLLDRSFHIYCCNPHISKCALKSLRTVCVLRTGSSYRSNLRHRITKTLPPPSHLQINEISEISEIKCTLFFWIPCCCCWIRVDYVISNNLLGFLQ